MIKKFIKEAVVSAVGKNTENVIDLLDSAKYINEFVIAKRLNMTINQVRNILYRLSDHNLVSSIRKKDWRKGWYTYFWKIELLKTLEFVREELQKKIRNLEGQIKSRESKVFYYCERCNVEYTEESALFYNFICNECGSVFSMKDNSKVLKETRASLEKLKNDLNFINNEIEKEKDRIRKKLVKEGKKKSKEKGEVQKKSRFKISKKEVRKKKILHKKKSKPTSLKKKNSLKKKIKNIKR
ncbi:MAG: hypothetical protein QXU40_01210 [Candidatus Pacearchaeota archaeon]